MNQVLHAIADPTRRKIIHLVSRRCLNVNAIADNFDMSRPAVSKHIKVLADCGLVVIRQEGRDRYCQARLEKLYPVLRWVERVGMIYSL